MYSTYNIYMSRPNAGTTEYKNKQSTSRPLGLTPTTPMPEVTMGESTTSSLTLNSVSVSRYSSSRSRPPIHTSSHHTHTPYSTRSGWINRRNPWPCPRHLSCFAQTQTKSLLLIALLLCIFSSTTALNLPIEERMIEASDVEAPMGLLGSTLARFARSGTIVVDPRPQPIPADWTQGSAAAAEELLRARDVAENSSSPKDNNSPTSSAAAAAAVGSSSTVAPTSTTFSGITVATTQAATALPTPFDVGFSNNLTSNCNSFMENMLANATFKTCLPFSLLLQNSNSFFQASKSLVRITQTLDYSCSADFSQCSALMSSFASNITTTLACSSDLASNNPLIQQARLGLEAYDTLYSASCLRNPSTSSYCFADAITNATNPTDGYIYFLPLNVSLVGGSLPTCDSCLKNTMAVFEAASADRKLAISSVYVAAASQVNMNCGPGSVNASLAADMTSNSIQSTTQLPGLVGLWMVVIVAMTSLFL